MGDGELDGSDRRSEAKKEYEVPELIELGDVADLTGYDVSVIAP